MLPKVLSGLLNTLLFFSSGAVYAVHGFRSLIVRDAPVLVALPDFLILCAIGSAALAAGTLLFRRSL